MFLTRSEYDRGVNTFSPEGRLFQVEYAIEAIKVRMDVVEKALARLATSFLFEAALSSHSALFSYDLQISSCFVSTLLEQLGSTAIGIQTSEGVVLAVEKRVTSSLLEGSSIEKIVEIDRHLGCAMSGLIADSRTMIDHARIEAQVGRQADTCSSIPPLSNKQGLL